VPVADFLEIIPSSAHIALFSISLLLMGGIVFRPSRKLAIAIVIIEIILCLLDQNRWQPWEYQFILMLFSFAVLRTDSSTWHSWLIIISGIYFFSGFSKLSPDFIHDTWNWLILQRGLGIDHPTLIIQRIGYMLPVFEMLIGLLLWIKRLKKFALVMIVILHVFNLVLLGPAGLNINPVIWPWNIFMPLACFYLLSEKIYYRPMYMYQWMLIILCLVMPFSMRFGVWDRYLSFTLYSGGMPQLMICSDEPDISKFNNGMDRSNSKIPCDSKILAAWDWGMNEMNTAPYPEYRVFKKIAKDWRKRYPGQKHQFYVTRSGFRYKVEKLDE